MVTNTRKRNATEVPVWQQYTTEKWPDFSGIPNRPTATGLQELAQPGYAMISALGEPGTSSTGTLDTLERQFRELADRWYQETAAISSVTKKALHDAYQAIIAKGKSVIPLILRELRDRHEPDDWFWALNYLAGRSAVAPEHRGNVRQMAQDWLEWGERMGYIY